MRSSKLILEYLGIGLGILTLVILTTSLDKALNPIDSSRAMSSVQLPAFPEMSVSSQLSHDSVGHSDLIEMADFEQ